MSKGKIPASSFLDTIVANVNNKGLSDDEFREFIRDTLPIVEGSNYTHEDRDKADSE